MQGNGIMTAITYLEIAWTVIALIGVVITLFILIDGLQDLRYLRENAIPRNDPGAILVRSDVRSDAIRFAIECLFLMVGCITLFVPAGPVEGNPVLFVVHVFVPLGLMAGAVLLVIKSVLDWLDRRRAATVELVRMRAQEQSEQKDGPHA